MEREDALLAQFGQDYCLPIFNAKLYDREAGEEEGRREFVVVLLASNFVVVDSFNRQAKTRQRTSSSFFG